jgi:hypothetical protein
MKKLVQEIENEGFEKLLGEKILVMCVNYFYTGKLIGVNESCILIENPSIVYETGKWGDGEYKDDQTMHIDELYIQISSIESFGKSK